MPPTGSTATPWRASGDYDVLVVDRMLPKLDGLSLIRSLREQKRRHAGADPLGARRRSTTASRACAPAATTISPSPTPSPSCSPGSRCWRAAAPRSGTSEPTAYRVGDLELDRLSHRVTRQGARDRAAAARVPPARIPDEERRPGGDPHHAARACLGLSFRSADQRHRRARLAAARQDRQGLRPAR